MQIGCADIRVPSWGNWDVVQDGRGDVALELQGVSFLESKGKPKVCG